MYIHDHATKTRDRLSCFTLPYLLCCRGGGREKIREVQPRCRHQKYEWDQLWGVMYSYDTLRRSLLKTKEYGEATRSERLVYHATRVLTWDRILGRDPDKTLKSFPPCYSQSSLQLCLRFLFLKTYPLYPTSYSFCEGKRRKTWYKKTIPPY